MALDKIDYFVNKRKNLSIELDNSENSQFWLVISQNNKLDLQHDFSRNQKITLFKELLYYHN